jgi:type IV pilus biogenesis protein CpaD/CtpE
VKLFLLAALAAATAGCANQDPYQDPTYTLQRNLYNRNQKWDAYQNRQYLRRQAQDDRYQAWFNSVME